MPNVVSNFINLFHLEKNEQIMISYRKLFPYFLLLFTISYISTGCSAVGVVIVATIKKKIETDTSQSQKLADEPKKVWLRLSCKNLHVTDVHGMEHIKMHERKSWGFYGYSTINHDYALKKISGDKVVVDHVTGLMWHQSGSNDSMNLEDAKHWIELLNISCYAGYSDWMLPTVEVATSLLESSKMHDDNEYIDPIFDGTQGRIWTGDSYYRLATTWRVDFFRGLVEWNDNSFAHYVRPVRLLNHKDLKNTQRYSHHCPESFMDGVQVLEKVDDKPTIVAQNGG